MKFVNISNIYKIQNGLNKKIRNFKVILIKKMVIRKLNIHCTLSLSLNF